VLITGNFSTIFCFIADPIDIPSYSVDEAEFCFAFVIIVGSSIAFARTMKNRRTSERI
jgi:hypothetical protein